MIRSMTGFGSAMRRDGGGHFEVEIRSLNNKYFKAQVRLPEELQSLEAVLESALAKRLSRGSVVVAARWTPSEEHAIARVNAGALRRYLDEVLAVEGVTPDMVSIDLAGLGELPGVLSPPDGEAQREIASATFHELLDEACDELIAMRGREGEMLHRDLHQHCSLIAEQLSVVATRVPALVEQYQEKLRSRMEAMLAKSGTAVREEDLLREVAVFAERSDVAEEFSRLQGHVDQFRQMIDSDEEKPIGRTLDFLSQEMLRETNTIGSKCLDVEVSRRIVEIKGAIDRIKEQVQNVE